MFQKMEDCGLWNYTGTRNCIILKTSTVLNIISIDPLHNTIKIYKIINIYLNYCGEAIFFVNNTVDKCLILLEVQYNTRCKIKHI